MHPTLATQRLAIYARCATDNDRAIERQTQHAREAIARAGGDPTAARVFSDRARSGVARAGLESDRPGLAALLAAVDAGEFDAVLVDDAARLSRNRQVFDRIAERMATSGVALVRLDETLGTVEAS